MIHRIRNVVKPLQYRLILCLSLTTPLHADAVELVVRISSQASPGGEVVCALFSDPDGFPMDNSTARVQWLAADSQDVSCRFADVPAGSYAVSIGHDMNGNKQVDMNFLGMPTEQWGVSNNIRPRLRSPRFSEASFEVIADPQVQYIDIQVAQ